ncbi:hypothetical protein LCGC14_1873700 [marine sediment metagenome]|uniref:7-cyano-7-deazaguanine synthase n=1 Tax=marine sediment metagenome TaxID=412755 RepID=A0A0F9G4D6_9ZZZZ
MQKIDEFALVIFSGGQDSTTCLIWALKKFKKVSTITFNYNQRHQIEIESAKKIINILNLSGNYNKIEHKIVDISFLSNLLKTAMIQDTEIKYDSDTKLPTTFVPGRNILFLTIAAAYAYQHKIKHLITGVCQTDYSGYPDCRDATIKSLQATLKLGMEYDIIIHTPLMWKNKTETIKMMQKLGRLELYKYTYTCFIPKTKILTPEGNENIENLKKGDFVYTANGNIERINRIYINNYEGKLVKIKSYGYPYYLIATPNHKIFTLKDCDKEIKKIEKGNWVKGYKLKLNNKINIDLLFARFLGYFASEGCYTKDGLCISMNKEKDKKDIKWLIQNIPKIFNKNPKMYDCNKGKNANIHIFDVKLVDKFYKRYGNGYCNERDFREILKWNKIGQDEFLIGLFRGDGFISKFNDSFSISLTNIKLIENIYIIFNNRGLCPRVSEKSPKNCNGKLFQLKIDQRINQNNESRRLAKMIFNIGPSFKYCREVFIRNNNSRRIYRKELIDYKGKVYNLEVEKEHSYIANYFPVHNCYKGKSLACGECPACKLRLNGFKEAGLQDPIKYSN